MQLIVTQRFTQTRFSTKSINVSRDWVVPVIHESLHEFVVAEIHLFCILDLSGSVPGDRNFYLCGSEHQDKQAQDCFFAMIQSAYHALAVY